MKKYIIILGVCLLSVIQVAAAQTDKDTIVATVNGSKVSSIELEEMLDYVKKTSPNNAVDMRPVILDGLILKEAVAQEVNQQGLLKRPENQLKLRLAQQGAVFDIWFSEYLKTHPVTDQEIKLAYDALVKQSKEFRYSKEYNVSHILLATEDQANKMIKLINSGALFETLAKKTSIHKESSSAGGNLGWVLPSDLVSPLGEVVLNLGKNKIGSVPVKSAHGWHVIRVNDVRDRVIAPFDQLKNSISSKLLQKRRDQAVSELMTRTKVSKN